MSLAILTDLTRCVGCRGCVLACKEINELPAGSTERLSSLTWTALERRAGLNVRRQCMHCVEPACASVCPVGALKKLPSGPVVYNERLCMGCRYCMAACPFRVPKYEWDKQLPRVRKCVMCYDKRLKNGKPPACTTACPTQATVFGNRDDLIREARSRIRAGNGRYVDRVFGLEEAGGTSVLYLSSVPFDKLGFPTAVDREPYPLLTWKVLSKIPDFVGVWSVVLLGVWWIVSRRMELERHGEGEHPGADRRGSGRWQRSGSSG
ncbi:MAG: 4Fe-4S dicluster domain-containing protein [Candidatus Riflebacteria bacterium]|nr:4Fe-4S dicluster domain-containing protein [Candidatus Riflebacteria bacterium]